MNHEVHECIDDVNKETVQDWRAHRDILIEGVEGWGTTAPSPDDPKRNVYASEEVSSTPLDHMTCNYMSSSLFFSSSFFFFFF